MPQLLAVLYICAKTLTPDACTRETAVDVFEAPARTNSACHTWAQTTLGNNPELLDDKHYPKTACERRRLEATAQ